MEAPEQPDTRDDADAPVAEHGDAAADGAVEAPEAEATTAGDAATDGGGEGAPDAAPDGGSEGAPEAAPAGDEPSAGPEADARESAESTDEGSPDELPAPADDADDAPAEVDDDAADAPRAKASLKPHLAEIRAWVAQGRTDIWIAHVLSSTPASISAFRSAHGILRRHLPQEGSGTSVPPPVLPPDATIEEPQPKPRRRSRRARGAREKAPAPAAAAAPPAAVEAAPAASRDGDPAAPTRRRRRGGRGRRRAEHTFEGVLDPGDEGYGFWLDGAVRDDSVFAEHWSGRRALIVRITPEEIIVRPQDDDDAGDGS